MKKTHFVLIAAVLCGVFLIFQFLLHHHTIFTPVSTITLLVIDTYTFDRLQLIVIHLKTRALVLLKFLLNLLAYNLTLMLLIVNISGI